MESSNQKYITLCFVATAIAGAYVMSVFLDILSRTWVLFARHLQGDFIVHGIPVTAGIILFFSLQFNPRVVKWADEVIMEVQQVVWPSRKDTLAMTFVVTVMLIISGILLGAFDLISNYIVNYVINL